ncbi:MAG TPA: hypothetical protein VNE18_03980, partial [Rhodanobacter sp.]|nr:hypothetical protein [Rhodanobacter sp.]
LAGSLALLAVVLLLAGFVGWRRLTAEHAPVPLLPANAPSPSLSGWLIQTTQNGGIHAIHIGNGEQRLLVPETNNADVQTMLAPDQRHLAQLIITRGENANVTLRDYALDGTLLHEWTGLDPANQNRLLGWMNVSTILVASNPNSSPQDLEPAMVSAFDGQSGTRRTLFAGWINGAAASPDGRYLAIDQYSDTGSVLEIRPVAGAGLGAPVATYAQGGTPLAWTKDDRLIFWSTTASNSAIKAISLDGTVTEIAQSTAFYAPNVLGFSPDRAQMIYVTNSGSAGVHPWTYWELNLSGGEPRELVEGNASYALPGNVVWSPSGDVVALTLSEPFYLPHPAQTGSATSIASYRTVAFGAAGQTRGSLFDQFTDQALLAWLPDGALPTQAEAAAQNSMNTDTSSFKTVGLPELGGLRPELSNTSGLSPDRSKALIYDPTYDVAMAIPVNGSPPVQIGGPPTDSSWLPDSSGGIGVQQHTLGNGSISRIDIYGDVGNGTMSVTDYDPAQLGNSTAASYRYPMLSPNGLRYSFFVVDSQRIALWVGGYDGPPRVVTSWQNPAGAKVDPPLIAEWVDNDTLIYSEPESWRGGLPQRVTLHRLVLIANATSDTGLIRWQPHGNEHGIVLQELRLSADQTEIAVRLRHITGNDPSKDAFDSIAVVSSRDLQQSFELARGETGAGLSWSPDGTQMVSVTEGKLTIFTIHSGGIEHVDTGDASISFPLWVLPNEIWYESSSGVATQMLRATR